MSILITADWQAEWQNLDLCSQAWKQVLEICEEKKLHTIAICGDLKRQYSPIDVRVPLWWQSAIRKARKRDLRVIIVLGNHDRVGQYSDAVNWLPILRNAGAECFDFPTITQAEDYRLFILPFASVSQTKRWAKFLLQSKPTKKESILLFHQDLKDAQYNQMGGKSDAKLTCGELHTDVYRFCIGGHIHCPQRLATEQENVYYVGSPFCQDWGEVNQRKRYLVLGEGSIRSINSKIAGWFDPSVAGFNASRPPSWANARLRISVSCDASEDYSRRLDRARKKAEHKYPGAILYVIPEFKDDDGANVQGLTLTDSDERKIREYVRQTDALDIPRFSENVVEYMLEKLSHFAGGLRSQAKTTFIKGKGRYFTSFQKLDIDYRQKGITVIQGTNLDRSGKSNGSGKTNALQLIPVSWFGRTFKGQTHDRWSNRWEEKAPAIAKTVVKDYKDRVIEITRGRRPPLLQMSIDGKQQSSGMKTTDREGTQAQIEQVTGFTWQTLANAIYIDRSIADAFLSGTKKQRTELLSRFQNLERFSQAHELVKKDARKNSDQIGKRTADLLHVKGQIQDCKESLVEMKQLSRLQLDGAYDEWQRAKKELEQWASKNGDRFERNEKSAQAIEKEHQAVCARSAKAEKRLAVRKADVNRIKEQADAWVNVISSEQCPTCFQTVSKAWLRKHGKEIAELGDEIQSNYDKAFQETGHLLRKEKRLEAAFDEYQVKLNRLERERSGLKLAAQTTERQYKDLYERQHGAESILGKMKQKLGDLKEKKSDLKEKLYHYQKKNKLYEYAMQAFSRDGIPAFLNRQLCPVLNKAADYYAELFSDRDVQVRFMVEGGEFVPQIINARGGADIEDQSTGERALAGLIASFALREVAPQCNLLVLDEPGEGLDSQTARQFAQALQKLTKRFGSIFICTHNQVILSELSGERMLTVQKKNRISKIIEAA